MNIEVALILSVIPLVGAILVTQLWQHNWYKRENFRVKIKNIKDENRLVLKKLEQEMGLKGKTAVSSVKEKTPLLESAPDLLKILGALDKETLQDLAERFLGGDIPLPGGETEGLADILINFAEENPEIAKGFLEGLASGKKTEAEHPSQL